MKNKKILIGSLVALGLIGAGFYFVNKKKEKVFDKESEVDFDFNNASGNELQNIVNRPKKIIKVKDYQALMKNGNLTELKKYLVGKNIYTFEKGVNLRESAYVNNGLNDNIALTLKNKGVYVGKVENVVRGTDGKNIWFLISNKGYNPSFSEKMFYYSGFGGRTLYDSRKDVYVRADVVVVDLY
jgi:hypothetical protein